MRRYELTYLISRDLSEEEIKIFQNKIASLIQEAGGTFEEIKDVIKKETGYLSTLNFYFAPEKLENFEKQLAEESKIFRYLILSKNLPKKTAASAKPPRSKELKLKLKPEPKSKVELKEIEEKLEEILGK